jgi:hypothetical protein
MIKWTCDVESSDIRRGVRFVAVLRRLGFMVVGGEDGALFMRTMPVIRRAISGRSFAHGTLCDKTAFSTYSTVDEDLLILEFPSAV